MEATLAHAFGDLALGEVYPAELRVGDIVAVTDDVPAVVVATWPAVSVRSFPHAPPRPLAAVALAGRYLDQLEAWARLCALWRSTPAAQSCAACAHGTHDPAALV